MRMTELIGKKQEGQALTSEEIRWMIEGYTGGSIPDYQMSAMCMAVYFRDMSLRETYDLTMAMLDSGDTIDLSAVSGVKADKHSTGGVGDKTSLVLCPMMAACGVKMAKLSGRGLGHTGGTIDKLESFPGFSADMSREAFLRSVEENGFAIAGQTAGLCPADKKLYALRDVTSTVASRPLIVSSILSKKLASGADVIVLDVKSGSGTFMTTQTEAFALARMLAQVGAMAGKKVSALVTDMDEPLGHAVGNALEVREAIAALKGEYTGDLMELCFAIGGQILRQSALAPNDAAARKMMQKTIRDGSAFECFARFIKAQGGDSRAVYDVLRLPRAPVVSEILSRQTGYVNHIDAKGVGLLSMELGGGRVTKDSAVDLAVGVVLAGKVGDRIERGQCLGVIHARTQADAEAAEERLRRCFTIAAEKKEKTPLIRGIVE